LPGQWDYWLIKKRNQIRDREQTTLDLKMEERWRLRLKTENQRPSMFLNFAVF